MGCSTCAFVHPPWWPIALCVVLVGASAQATKQPRVQPAWAKRVAYGETGGRLVVGGVSGADVVQGRAGDCYFLGPLSSIARARPRTIAESIVEHADGTVSVRLYRRARKSGKLEPVRVRVDRALPRFKNGTALNARTKQNELWVALVEKAYAKLARAGYGKIAQGGHAELALRTLTGRAARQLFVADLDEDKLFATLQRTLERRGVAVASTFTSADFRSRAKSSYTGTGLWPGHVYSVWGVSTVNGRRMIKLRDPYGDRPLIKISVARFKQLYEDIVIQ